MSSSKIKRLKINFLFSKEISLIGLSLFIKIGNKESVGKSQSKSFPVFKENKTKKRKKIVPTELFQIRAKSKKGKREKIANLKENAKRAPKKVAIPLPPANLRKIDQL